LFDYFSNAPVLDVIVKCIADSPLFIADVTTRNPNVLWELGIRHAFVPTGTLVLREADEQIPFNLTNIFLHTYQLAEDYSGERQRLTENIEKIVADKVPNLVYRKARYARDFHEYEASLEEFHARAPYEQSIFVMTKYPEQDPGKATSNDKDLARVINLVKDGLDKRGFTARLASDKPYQSMLWKNIEVYLLGCARGIAIVENKYNDQVNPNVAMEWGWMRAAKKDVLYLLEEDFENTSADFSGFLSARFSWSYPEKGIEEALNQWLGPSKPR
jgi:hypothetical protein